jgi:hypothetical protein
MPHFSADTEENHKISVRITGAGTDIYTRSVWNTKQDCQLLVTDVSSILVESQICPCA